MHVLMCVFFFVPFFHILAMKLFFLSCPSFCSGSAIGQTVKKIYAGTAVIFWKVWRFIEQEKNR